MSIMNRNKRLRYFNQGGANDYTTDVTYGVPVAQTGTPTTPGFSTPQIAGPNFTPGSDYATAVNTAAEWQGDAANQPGYYPGATVAGFDPAALQAQQRLTDVAGQYDTITNQRIGAYQDDLDPNSAYNQRATQQAAQQAGNAYFGAGTPGSARGQYASSLASREALDNNRYRALQGLAGAQGSLTGGADILNQVGADRQLQSQRDIDEDIKRFNFGQLAPQQQVDQQLALRAGQEAVKAGNAPVSNQNDPYTNSRGYDYLGWARDNILPTIGKTILSNLLNEGGPVHYKQDGGIIGQTAQGGGMSPQGYAQNQMPMQQAPAPAPMPAPQPVEMMESGIMEMDEMSEIDMMEDRMNAMAIQSGGDIIVTRKETRRKAK